MKWRWSIEVTIYMVALERQSGFWALCGKLWDGLCHRTQCVLTMGSTRMCPLSQCKGRRRALSLFNTLWAGPQQNPVGPPPPPLPPRFLLSLKPQCLGVNSLPEIMLVLVHVFFIWKISDVVSQSDYSETSNSRLMMEDTKCLFKTKEVFLIL